MKSLDDTSEGSRATPWKCLFCRMRTGERLFRLPLCAICRDQVQDFIWVSLVQLLLVVAGFMGGWLFVVDEILLFVVLVVVKHKMPPVFDRFTATS